jgi:hypothetical protein
MGQKKSLDTPVVPTVKAERGSPPPACSELAGEGYTMAKVTESGIKAALSARDKETRADAKSRRAMLARLQDGRRQGERALTSYLKKTGFDFKACDRIRAKQEAEMHRLVKEAGRAAAKRATSRRKDLAYGVANWRKTIERFRDGTLVSQFVAVLEVVDTPFIIWPTNGLELVDSQIQPWNNTAKVRAQWRDDRGYENVRFIFVWDNPNDAWAVINVESNLTVNGSCDAFAEGGFFLGSLNTLWVQASLNVWEWWNQPPTMLSPQATQVQKVLSVTANGGGFLSNLGGGSIDSESAAGMFDVRRTLFSLPPRGVAVFEVTLEFFYKNDGGGMIQAGFAFGDSGVRCPAVVIAVLS